MMSPSYIDELRRDWFPHTTDAGLNRVIELLDRGSPLLIHGAFTRTVPMGCLATQIAWHHPVTSRLNEDAGIWWLTRLAGLNPATSQVLRMWDETHALDWAFRDELLTAFREERLRRRQLHGETAELSEVAVG
jgi:hypothetical protein